ncbi:MAG TPA: malto-oligosyltrehalose trehalohydrolase [Candidatus Limnocylindria bacterium]|nr:malto-oligosyltrehalose trehalohydrolase [Candidatus Limnocylindria bacterium]
MTLGAVYEGGGRCTFTVWAPNAKRVEVRLGERIDVLRPAERGYHTAILDDVSPGDRYAFVLDGRPERADPASRWQPDGLHGPSAVVDPRAFRWTDAGFSAPRLRDLVIYELHIGTFTPEGTFDAATRHFRELRELGVNAIEPLPIAQFPGARNWGYDGVLAWAAQDTYGGPEGLRRFVDAAHREGLAVLLDVVYNHVGPEGNYLPEFGPYFTERYHTPWGAAINFDGPESDEVRRYYIESALMWLRECHADGFRLDAVHAIIDASARPFLAELNDAVHEEAQRLGRTAIVIAESDQNDVAVITPTPERGLGFDATWSDDFHHAVHALLTGERTGYYRDFGDIAHLAATLGQGWAYAGERSAFRRRRHGNVPAGALAERFVVAVQNHDQVGNRARGDRLATLVDAERLKVAAAALLLSPFTPMLFMGEEHGERRPFQYFTSHTDAALIEAVRRGRREEFKEFAWQGEVPDPQAEDTFRASVIDRASGSREIRVLYRELLQLRSSLPGLRPARPDPAAVVTGEAAVGLLRDGIALALAFGAGALELPPGAWRVRLDTADTRFGGPGAWQDAPAGRLVFDGPRALLLERA